jgi:hypothetical protein
VAIGAIAFAAPAGASSIVYVKGGNVWLASADGSGQRQVTTGGGWDSPSQADDGTILAQRGTLLVRMNRQGRLLVPAFDTIFSTAASGSGDISPISPVISPDGVHQAYGALIEVSQYYDPSCGCYRYHPQWFTRWGSATAFDEPGQTVGQEDYVDPAWLDNSHVILSTTGILIDQVATYTLGGGDNSEVQWFSDPSVGNLTNPAVTRAGDKLAFIANLNGGVGNEIRIYASTGPPPLAAGDAANAPVDTCNIGPNSFQSVRLAFSPDGGSLAYDAPDGIHLISLAGWPSCAGLSDRLIIPGGSLPYFSPANVAPPLPPHAARCVVPRLRGLSLTAAKSRLRAAHCRLGRVRSPRTRHGGLVVTSQSVPAGRRLARGSRVNVSLGTPRPRSHHP